MALITCSECGHKISDKAPFCPSCGAPQAVAGPSKQSIRSVPIVASSARDDLGASGMPFSSPWGSRNQQSLSSTSVREQTSGRITFRVIDWYRAITLTVLPLLIAFVCYGSVADRTSAAVLWAAGLGLVALWLAKVHFTGTTFDTHHDLIIFPTFLFRRRVPLSKVRDANCVYIERKITLPTYNYDGVGPKTQTRTKRIYAVDLSGDFGGRQIKFWSRKRRDQFLSELRELQPECRITRWASGSGEY